MRTRRYRDAGISRLRRGVGAMDAGPGCGGGVVVIWLDGDRMFVLMDTCERQRPEHWDMYLATRMWRTCDTPLGCWPEPRVTCRDSRGPWCPWGGALPWEPDPKCRHYNWTGMLQGRHAPCTSTDEPGRLYLTDEAFATMRGEGL